MSARFERKLSATREAEVVRAAVDNDMTVRRIATYAGVTVSTAHAIMVRHGYHATRIQYTRWIKDDE